MSFAAIPPEVNSGLMYAGPGSGPMLAAAAAWDGLAAELRSAVAASQSVISEVEGAWRGPSSAAMMTAVTPYLGWLTTTASRVEQTAGQVKAAAAAYEAAFAMTVPPWVVAANRAQLATLIATNFLGQNSAAIAVTEAHYGEMWAQDAAAMDGYASASVTAADVQPFDAPPQTTNPLSQAAAIQQASGNPAVTGAPQTPSHQLAAALQGLTTSTEGTPISPVLPAQAEPMGLFDVLGILADELGIGVALPLSVLGVWLAGAAMYYAELDSREILESQDILAGGQHTILDAIAELGASGSFGGAPLSAGLGQAVSAGNLSVPPSWATAAPEIRTTAYAAPSAATSTATPGGLGTAFSQMALAGMAGSAVAGAAGRGRQEPAGATIAGQPEPPERSEPVAGAEPTPSEPPRPSASSVLEMAAAVRALGELRDSGLLTAAEFAEEKRRLLGR